METIRYELRYAWRSLRRSPGFALAAVCTLALGIGAATALFSVVYGVLIRPLPYPDSERIVALSQVNEEGRRTAVSDPNFADWADRSRGFAALAQYQAGVTSVIAGSEASRRIAAHVSAGFFDVMAVQPALGRAFLPEEQHEGAAGAVVVSHSYWQNHLGGGSDLGAHRLHFFDRVHTVVGVMPAGFEFPDGTDLWVPRESRPVLPSRTALNWRVIGRLQDRVPVSAAQQEISAVTRTLVAEHGEIRWLADGAVEPLRDYVVGRVRPALTLLLGASALLLLIATANVANLLLARMAGRVKELSVLAALGADRWHLWRRVLAESTLIAALGGLLGVVLAVACVRVLLAAEPGNLPRADEIGLNPGVLAFALALSLLTAVAIGAVSAGRARADGSPAASLRSGGGRSAGVAQRRLQGAIVATQVALTLVLLAGAALVGRAVLRLIAVDPGFRTSGVVVMQVSAPPAAGDDDRALGSFYDELLERIRQLPGVAAAGGTTVVPLTGHGASGTFVVQNHPDEVHDFEAFEALVEVPGRSGYAAFRVASDGYFAAMGIPLVDGRDFAATDARDAPHVALVSESLARVQWPGEDPLGRLIQFGNMDGDLRPFTVIGVVADVRDAAIDQEPQPTVYALHRQRPASTTEFSVVMQVRGGSAAVGDAARSVLRDIAPAAAARIRTIEEVVAAPLAPRRFSLMLLGAFASTALLLAVAGIHGVTAYSVSQRTREIGIRVALGARARGVVGMVVRQGVMLAVVGIGAGMLAALALGRVVEHLLYDVSRTDPVAVGGAAALLLTVAAVASYLPARRAARIDPMNALRSE